MQMILNILTYWTQLPGVILLLYFFAFIVLYWARAAAVYLCIIATALLYGLSTPIAASFLANTLEKQYPPLSVEQIQHDDLKAIVVLGGGRRYAPEYKQGEAVSAATLVRVDYAAYLQQQTHLPIFAMGAGAGLTNLQLAEATLMQQALEHKKTIQNIYLETRSNNTYENALYAKKLLDKFNIKHFILVTSASHMPRAMQLFQSFELLPVAAPTDYLATKTNVKQPWRNWMPNAHAFLVSARVWHEYLGMLRY